MENAKFSARTLGVLMISIAKDDVGRDSVCNPVQSGVPIWQSNSNL